MLVRTYISENTAVVLAATTDTNGAGNDKVKRIASARVYNAKSAKSAR